MHTFVVPKYARFRGDVSLKGDKSISHRVLIFSSLCERQETTIFNMGFSDDTSATEEILLNLGVEVRRDALEGEQVVRVLGKGIYLDEPRSILHARDSGTTARVFCPILSAQRFPSVLDGGESLRRRPMRRVVEPLLRLGARIWGREDGNRLPLVFEGVGKFKGGLSFEISVASAQVKTALIISNFWSDDAVKVKEPYQSRDHTERILPAFSVDVRRDEAGYIWAIGKPRSPGAVRIPGDISSASFIVALAVISKGSEITVKDVSLNPTRLGFLEVLQRMGARIQTYQSGEEVGEPYGDIHVSSSELTNVSLEGEIIPRIIDEIPILSICALFGDGVFSVKDAADLRVKETDRIHAICHNLRKMGVEVYEQQDGFGFEGLGRCASEKLTGRYMVETFGDHRIAMAFSVLGTSIAGEVILDDVTCISKSYPDFFRDLQRIGVR